MIAVVLWAATVLAQVVPTIAEVRVEQEGRVLDDRLINGLIETTAGEPLSMREVRETLSHLTSLNRFEDIQVFQEPAAAGIRLRYVLFPLHPVDRMEFRGTLGVPEDDLRRVFTERFGEAPSAGRAQEITSALLAFYRDRGYAAAQIVPRIEETHNPDRATMAFEIRAGSRSSIGRVDVDEVDSSGQPVLGGIPIAVGDPFDNEVILRELDRYIALLHTRGYYEARASHAFVFEPDGTATVNISIDRGPVVSIAFAGDPLPEADRDRLVPVRSEGSADEDLLEDANAAIEEYLQARGYRDAAVEYARTEGEAAVTITYKIARGPRYVVDTVSIAGNLAIPTMQLAELVQVEPGEPYVQAQAGAGAAAMRNTYRSRGFTRADVRTTVVELPRDNDAAPGIDRHVEVRYAISEGPRTVVGSIGFEGNTVFAESQLRALMATVPERAYSESEIAQDRDRIDLEYRNRGYEAIVVTPVITLIDSGTRADVRFQIAEGQQVLVDHVIIVGNQRTSTETIEREVLLKPGEPLGYSARIETQQRLAALGLFRRVVVDELRHSGETRRDVLIQVDEAPPTTIGYGGGVEGGTRLRPTGDGGRAEERFEVAPRGFLEISRRNLWGKNRAVTLFTRVSLRSRDIVLSREGIRLERPAESSYGFNEYRVVGTFREPRLFDTRADGLVTGILDQAIRSSFNFVRREARAEAGVRFSTRYSLAGRYSYEHTRLFDEKFTEDEKPLIDRLFPQVRLSKFSGSFIRDTRNDVIDPDGGTFIIVDAELAPRLIGSEVGFLRTFGQGFAYYRVPAARRLVLAFGARVGAAHGFRRTVARENEDGLPVLGPDGQPVVDIVQDLPASERFFAGGDTTVRGFSLDRLGTDATISPTGFPTGGNGLVVLNGELRATIVGSFGAVAFIDAGNVFLRATDLDFGALRAAAGVGVRYLSPVGPIRIDMGFKLDRRELSPGRLERRSVLHISLGQAF
jgi:outer membrane protein assembly complex protein YaeT